MKLATTMRQIDDLLRGRLTRAGDSPAEALPVRTLLIAAPVLGGLYGLFMGMYGLLRPDHASVAQWLVTVGKVPLLFLLTLVVTFPSLYVFSALSDSSLRPLATLRLLLAAICVNLALLASLGPVTGFFTLSTESYPFMVLLNTLFFAASGGVGLWFLHGALRSVFRPPDPAVDATEPGGAPRGKEGLPFPRRSSPTARSTLVFRLWVVIYGLVGAQMGWILRPFVGAPELPFELFRERQSNFFAALFRALEALLS